MIAVCVVMWAGAAYGGGKSIVGTLISPSGDTGALALRTDKETVTIQSVAGAKILRGQVGMDFRRVTARELAPGDQITAILDQSGRAVTVKALFGIVKGDFAGMQSGRLRLRDGREVPLNDQTQVVLLDGRIGRVLEIKPGTLLICRVNPSSNEAWTVLAATTDKTAQVGPSVEKGKVVPAPEKVAPPKPKIQSIAYTAPAAPKPGDVIMVELSGTPGAKASFEIRYFMPAVPMKEVSPGRYRGQIKVPADKSVTNAPVVGYMTLSGAKASPVQAAKLVTIDGGIEPVVAKEEPAVIKAVEAKAPPAAPVVPTPAVPAHVVVPVVKLDKVPEPPKQLKNVAITMPPDGATIRRALTIKGEASPDSKVMVTVTYSNGLTGLLKLAGQVASQTIAVGSNGEFGMGPIPLEGTLATKGLIFTVKAYYPDREDHGTAMITVTGDRS